MARSPRHPLRRVRTRDPGPDAPSISGHAGRHLVAALCDLGDTAAMLDNFGIGPARAVPADAASIELAERHMAGFVDSNPEHHERMSTHFATAKGDHA